MSYRIFSKKNTCTAELTTFHIKKNFFQVYRMGTYNNPFNFFGVSADPIQCIGFKILYSIFP